MSVEKSTIVRPTPRGRQPEFPTVLPRRAPAPVRAAFRAMDPVAPGLAVRIVDHLWFRLQSPPPAADRRRATPAGGRPFTTIHGSLRIHGRGYGPEDAPLAVLVHGWAGWWQQLAPQVEPLLEAGYRVVAYDAPSHGGSAPGRYGPRSSRVMELADAYTAITRQHGSPDLVVAHSIGAMATLWAAREHGTTAAAYVFLAAAASVHPMVDFFEHTLSLGPRARAGLTPRVERRVGHRFEEFEVPDMIGAVWGDRQAPPLLAIHDRQDRMTPARGTAAIAAAWPDSEVTWTEGLGHSRLLVDAATAAQVAAFAARLAGRDT